MDRQVKNSQVVDKRVSSTKEYVNALFDNYSKLNVVRIDLGYSKPYSDEITLEEANKDLNRMFNNMRSKPSIFKDKVGYICKKEYTEDRGVHIHTVFMFDGNKVLKDSYKAQQIGEYWKQMTDNKGSFHNCNLDKDKYEKNGIGMVNYNDNEKRENLDSAVSYLCKDIQSINEVKTNKQDRAFIRGTKPKSKGNVGRPRKIEEMVV